MPRGYLKNQPGVSRKIARGSGTHKSNRNKDDDDFYAVLDICRPNLRREAIGWSTLDSDYPSFVDCEPCPEKHHCRMGWECLTCTFVNENNEFLACEVCGASRPDNVDTTVELGTIQPKKKKASRVSTCSICCEEEMELVPLMNGCKHEPACYACLRRIFVTDAQQSVANFPLRCYHPSCRLPVRETQLVKHELVASKAELTRHFRMAELQKGYRGGPTMSTAHCPRCDHPRTFRNNGGEEDGVRVRFFTCKECEQVFTVPEYGGVIRALENLKPDKIGINDGWANCPKCNMLISKGSGCDHMFCLLCKHHFSWANAQSRQGRYATRPAPAQQATNMAPN